MVVPARLAVVAVLCLLGISGCKRRERSPTPTEASPPSISPATPPEILLHRAPVHALLATNDALVLLRGTTWDANPKGHVIELRPHGGGPPITIARTGPIARLVGVTAREVVWREWKSGGAEENRLFAAPLAGGGPPRAIEPGPLRVDAPTILEGDRLVGFASAGGGAILAAPVAGGGPVETLVRASPSNITSRDAWLASACATGARPDERPITRVGDAVYVSGSVRAGEVPPDREPRPDDRLSVVVCKVDSDRRLTVAFSRPGESIALLGEAEGRLIAVIDHDIVRIDGARVTPWAPLPRPGSVMIFGGRVPAELHDGDLFVLQERTVHRLRKGESRFEPVLAGAHAFVVHDDRLFGVMADGVASVPLGSSDR